MKWLFYLILFLIPQTNIAQAEFTEAYKAKVLIKTWGLLKYHHPEISKGKYNWDQEFLDQFEKIGQIETRDELNDHLVQWILEYGYDEQREKNLPNDIDVFEKNVNYEWIENSRFSPLLRNILNDIKDNISVGEYYASVAKLTSHVSFENEKGLTDFNDDIKAHRLLFLASLWNAMNYWNVNLYLAESAWSEVLEEMTPRFLNAQSTRDFELARLKLISSLNDSHTSTNRSYMWNEILKYHPPFGGRIVNDSLVVTKIYNQNLAKESGIQLGDVITKIEGVSVSTNIERFENLIGASNKNYLLSWAEDQFLLSNNVDSINIKKVSTKGAIEQKYIRLYDYSTDQISRHHIDQEFAHLGRDKKKVWQILDNNIAYINLEYADSRDVRRMFRKIGSTKGLIIDLRNYPKNNLEKTITKHIYPEKDVFVKILMPYLPSRGEYDGQSGMKFLKNPFSAGSYNPQYYDKKIVLLVDRNTVSKAEFLGMAIQNAPGSVTMGEQTAGAVMNTVEFTLSDRSLVNFTGMGAFYPNDVEVQRKGLKIDYMVEEKAQNYDPDGYIKEAIEVISNSNLPNTSRTSF